MDGKCETISNEARTEAPDDDDDQFEDASSVDQAVDDIVKMQQTVVLHDSTDDDEKTADIFEDCDINYVDDDSQRDFEKNLTDDEKLENMTKATELKMLGNEQFKCEKYLESIDTYSNALRLCPVDFGKERSILYGNRSAAKIKLGLKDEAVKDCTKSIEFNESYLKAFLRRAILFEELEKLDESLEDYHTILKMDPNNQTAKHAIMRLPQQINERNEKIKDEMLSKLKDLGNMVLKPFGLSTSNFQMQQDPNSGSYSVNFKQ